MSVIVRVIYFCKMVFIDLQHVSKECFMPITMEEEAEVANALSNSYRYFLL